MRLLVGLGNPGPKHRDNRHNIGFMAADEIVRRYNLSAPRSRFQSDTFEGTIDGEKVLLLKPTTFMNRSGQSVRRILDYYKISGYEWGSCKAVVGYLRRSGVLDIDRPILAAILEI